MVGVVALSACGGSDDGGGGGGGSTAVEQAEAAFDDFSEEIGACNDSPCTCTNGGTITTDAVEGTVVIDNCVSATNETYTGELTTTDGGATMNGSMTAFGACASGTATDLAPDTCSGTLVMTCPAGNVTCTLSGEDECDFTCL